MDIKNILWYIILGNTIYNYIIALILFVLIYFIILLLKKIVKKRIKKDNNNKRENIIVKSLSYISNLFYIALCIYIPLQYITVQKTFWYIIKVLFLIIVVREISNILIKIVKHILEKTLHGNNWKKDTTKINLFHIIAKIIIYITWWLLLLSNLWIEITPLLASVWVIGIAIAFALQKILGDIFSSFSIFFDKPFEIWDFIVIGWDSWNVKDIGLKSTRIQTLQWQELIIPNAEITWIRINNYWKMKKRRVVFTIGIVYKTDPNILEKIPNIIWNIIKNTENTEFDKAHFIEFWKSELTFEIIYYITTKDFKIYRDTHQKISLDIIKTFKKQKIEFAYPTQSIYIENTK